MESSDLCCGSAGTYNLTEPEAARSLAQRKADAIMATGADYVVLANPGYQFQIAAELRRRGAATKVVHLADFVAQAKSSQSPMRSRAAGASAERIVGRASLPAMGASGREPLYPFGL